MTNNLVKNFVVDLESPPVTFPVNIATAEDTMQGKTNVEFLDQSLAYVNPFLAKYALDSKHQAVLMREVLSTGEISSISMSLRTLLTFVNTIADAIDHSFFYHKNAGSSPKESIADKPFRNFLANNIPSTFR
jgi:hypothetical protein